MWRSTSGWASHVNETVIGPLPNVLAGWTMLFLAVATSPTN